MIYQIHLSLHNTNSPQRLSCIKFPLFHRTSASDAFSGRGFGEMTLTVEIIPRNCEGPKTRPGQTPCQFFFQTTKLNLVSSDCCSTLLCKQLFLERHFEYEQRTCTNIIEIIVYLCLCCVRKGGMGCVCIFWQINFTLEQN